MQEDLTHNSTDPVELQRRWRSKETNEKIAESALERDCNSHAIIDLFRRFSEH